MYRDGKPYYSLDLYYKTIFGRKAAKLPIDAGFSCPHRDPETGLGGCIFCGSRGSGEFAPPSFLSIAEQIEKGKSLYSKKWQNPVYIAYFQAFSNTYAPIPVLRRRYEEALSAEGISGLSIATRPDCIDSETLELLSEINGRTKLWVELGLQTSLEKTAGFINRGFSNECFDKAVSALHLAGINTVAHIILGLPGESQGDMINTVRYAASRGVSGVKLHMLYILKNTRLFEIYNEKPFHILDKNEYIKILSECIEHIPPDTVIHRITGDPPKKELCLPLWAADKKDVLNKIHSYMKENGVSQGKRL